MSEYGSGREFLVERAEELAPGILEQARVLGVPEDHVLGAVAAGIVRPALDYIYDFALDVGDPELAAQALEALYLWEGGQPCP